MARVSVMVMIGSCKNRIMRKFNFKGKMSALDAYVISGKKPDIELKNICASILG